MIFSPSPITDHIPGKDGTRAWLNLALLGVGQAVLGGMAYSLGALVTPMSVEFGVDASVASVGVNVFWGVYAFSTLFVNIILEKGYIGAKYEKVSGPD